MATTWFSAPAPVARRVRAYFAPVNRVAATPALFDPSEQGAFSLDSPPAPWISLGWIQDFARTPASKTAAVLSGIPAAMLEQVRSKYSMVEERVLFDFMMRGLSADQMLKALTGLRGTATPGELEVF